MGVFSIEGMKNSLFQDWKLLPAFLKYGSIWMGAYL